jgi:hypothetical protein
MLGNVAHTREGWRDMTDPDGEATHKLYPYLWHVAHPPSGDPAPFGARLPAQHVDLACVQSAPTHNATEQRCLTAATRPQQPISETRRTELVSFTLQLLYHRQTSSGTHWVDPAVFEVGHLRYDQHRSERCQKAPSFKLSQ